MGGGGRDRRDYNSVWVEGMAGREWLAGMQFCLGGGNGCRLTIYSA
ncbi:hypothetical protein T02_3580 [Trichinella nativa]|uniref:Uncharacterized protein n=1 Tax=Trichinella nativa TaxID=6335 RepID=A0A0V1KHI3_9BILA|nr:hypothetical protein T02_3580 [Trichinella nativa]